MFSTRLSTVIRNAAATLPRKMLSSSIKSTAAFSSMSLNELVNKRSVRRVLEKKIAVPRVVLTRLRAAFATQAQVATRPAAAPATPAVAVAAPAPAPPAFVNLEPLNFKSAGEIVNLLGETGYKKAHWPIWQFLLLAFMGGAFIALGGLGAEIVGGNTVSDASKAGISLEGIKKLLMGAVFPVGLIMTALTGSDLFTGNCMYATTAWLQRKINWRGVLRIFGLSWGGNLLGGLFVAYFMAHRSGLFNPEPLNTFSQKMAKDKSSLGWEKCFLRGIGCNILVCMGLFQGLASNELAGKILGLWWPVFLFVMCGMEHCVANMFFLPVGKFQGAHLTPKEMVLHNLIPATAGNIVGGAIIGGLYWAAHTSPHAMRAGGKGVTPSMMRLSSRGMTGLAVSTVLALAFWYYCRKQAQKKESIMAPHQH